MSTAQWLSGVVNVDSVHTELSNYVGFCYKYPCLMIVTLDTSTITQHAQELMYNSCVTVIYVGA